MSDDQLTEGTHRREFVGGLGVASLASVAGCVDPIMQFDDTDTEQEQTEQNEGTENYGFEWPPKAYTPEQMDDVGLLKRNEIHNWTTAAHAQIQTEMLKEQTEILREIRDELRE